ncbi:Molybdopterin-guanine dinucleotide biosynthesis protein MobA [Alloactinosynnema sp. L-07]|uniref:molybdenum cofactor guanylyltransferase n=1 Tax=Alloactinosynnema sp. L-07 TaxID=1653480 RepID=UPI00065EFD61|nr:nucleotidyltransferase family protein [Alloactinosynnema sp. L-07]CRK56211.1 Molybdopterin-guanine dinucleotide biosynthesis protein MobA [Alloactinosynnema sp. L-07]
MTWAAIVLAGGRATRLGGVDKPALEVGGRSMLAAAVTAVAGADRIVVVGPERPVPVPVVWTLEDEPGSGPVAALAAGLSKIDTADVVVVLAADLPLVSAETVARLLAAVGSTGVVLVDADGRDQWLLSAWPLGPLRAAMPEFPAGAALRRVLSGLDPARLPAAGAEAADVDTPADLARFGE